MIDRLDEIGAMVRRTARQFDLRTPEGAYAAGWDCAENGANVQNCHFGWFSTPSMRDHWERGKRDGEKAMRKP